MSLPRDCHKSSTPHRVARVMLTRHETRVHVMPASHGAPETRFTVHEWIPAEPRGQVLFVHALSGCGHDFAYLAEHLAARGLHCFAPDLPGHGRTAVVDGKSTNDALATRCLFSLAEILTDGPIYYLGSSWGGHILLPVLLTGMRRLDGLFLNDVVLEGHKLLDALPSRISAKAQVGLEDFEDVLNAIRAEAAGEYRQIDILDIRDDVLRDWAWQRFVEDASGRWSERFHATTVHALASTSNSDIPPAKSPARLISRLPCPVVMIYGSESPFADTKTLATLLKLRPNVSALTLKAGHAPKLMTDDQVSALLARFCNMGFDPVGSTL